MCPYPPWETVQFLPPFPLLKIRRRFPPQKVRQRLPAGDTGAGTSYFDSLWDWGTGLPQRDSVFEHIWSDSRGM